MYFLNKRNPTALERKKRLKHLLANTKKDQNGCLIWQGYAKDGAGISTVFNYNDKTHRHVYRLAIGRIKKNINILRICNNSLCINPEHLSPITHKDLILHIAHKSSILRSLKAGLSILTEKDYDEIIELAAYGIPYKDIAQKYNVSRHRVSLIALQNGIRRNKPHGKRKAHKKEKEDINPSSQIQRKKFTETCCQKDIRTSERTIRA